MASYIESDKENISDVNGNMSKPSVQSDETIEKNVAYKETIASSNQKRLEYLLKQAEIFSHFMNKADSPKSASKATKRQENKTKKRTKNGETNGQPNRRTRVASNDNEELANVDMPEKVVLRFDQSPHYIVGEMRDYQIRGLNWMISLYENGINGILADEMGLGKTIQTISMIGYLKHFRNISGPHIVIGPKSTLRNWLNEFNRFCPSMKALAMIGDAVARKAVVDTMRDTEWDVLLTTYEVCLSEKSALKRINWQYLVVDEAHRLKNEKTKLGVALRTFKSTNRLLLTGTPLQNNLHELWSLLNFLLPDVFDSADDFDTWFDSNDCLGRNGEDVVKRLHEVLRPFMLRRIKSEVEKSLLPKIETKIFIGLTKLQRKVYTQILVKEIDIINAFGCVEKKKLDNVLMHLRKAANHPYLFDGIEPGPPYTTDEHLVNACGKMMVLDKLLAKLKSQGSRVLIFSQFKMMLDILEDYLIWREYEYCRLDGDTDYTVRAESIDAYNAENSTKFIFMLSTRAGGLGINLATADTVIMYDSDWNPQPDLQAIDRVHRIGQKKQVRVFRLVTENTVDERIVQRAEIKLRLDKMVIQQGRSTAKESIGPTKETKKDMVRFGANYILSSEESDIMDTDIDKILEKGEQKTAQETAEYEKLGESELRNFTLEEASSTTVYQFEGTDFRTMRKQSDKIDMSMIPRPQRERRPVNYIFTKPDLKANNTSVTTKMKLIRLHDHQFYPKELHELCEEPTYLYVNNNNYNHDGEDDEDDVHDTKHKQKLLRMGFSDWSRIDYRKFCDAIIKYGRSDMENISQSVPGKTAEQVEQYSRVFWRRGKAELKNFDQIIIRMKRVEAKLNEEKSIAEALDWKMSLFDRPSIKLTMDGKFSKISGLYTKEQDRYLLCILHKYGVNQPDVYNKIRSEIQTFHAFRFDNFLKSRTAMELQQRCKILLSIITKEYLDSKKDKENGEVSLHTAGETSESRKMGAIKKRPRGGVKQASGDGTSETKKNKRKKL